VIIMANVETFAASEITTNLGIPISREIVCVLFISLIAIINLAGIEFSLKFQTYSSIFLIMSTIGICFYALIFGPDYINLMQTVSLKNLEVEEIISKSVDLNSFSLIIVTSIFLFVGFEWVTPNGKNEDAYKSLIPWSMPVAIIILAFVYILFTISVSKVILLSELENSISPQIMLGEALWGEGGIYLLSLLSFLAMLTSFNIGVLGASRLIYSVSREGYLPVWCSSISLRTMAPYKAILLLSISSLITSVFTVNMGMQIEMAHSAVIITCILYALIIYSAIRLRKSSLKRYFEYKIPKQVFYVILFLFLLLTFALCIDSINTTTPIILLTIMFFSLLISFFHKIKLVTWKEILEYFKIMFSRKEI
jgi:amino acid transporter